VNPIVFHRAARAELDESVAHYEAQREGLGLDLLASVESAITRIQRMPTLFPVHKQTEFQKCLLGRFPFTVFFLERADSIWVAAVAHQKRRPDYWSRRKPSKRDR
jgi:hypothetical protein